MLNKNCDYCKKELMSEKNADEGFVYSTWCIFHYRKRRDFCSDDCFRKWINDYFKKENVDEVNAVDVAIEALKNAISKRDKIEGVEK